MNAKESWYKSNFIVVGSNFNFSYYNTQAEKCLVNSNFNSKRRFSEYFANLKFNSYKMRKMQKKKKKKNKKRSKMKEKRKDQILYTKLYFWSFRLLLRYLCKNISYNFTGLAMFNLKHLNNLTLGFSMMNGDWPIFF